MSKSRKLSALIVSAIMLMSACSGSGAASAPASEVKENFLEETTSKVTSEAASETTTEATENRFDDMDDYYVEEIPMTEATTSSATTVTTIINEELYYNDTIINQYQDYIKNHPHFIKSSSVSLTDRADLKDAFRILDDKYAVFIERKQLFSGDEFGFGIYDIPNKKWELPISYNLDLNKTTVNFDYLTTEPPYSQCEMTYLGDNTIYCDEWAASSLGDGWCYNWKKDVLFETGNNKAIVAKNDAVFFNGAKKYDYNKWTSLAEGKIVGVFDNAFLVQNRNSITTKSEISIYNYNGSQLFTLPVDYYDTSFLQYNNEHLLIGAKGKGSGTYILIFDNNGQMVNEPSLVEERKYSERGSKDFEESILFSDFYTVATYESYSGNNYNYSGTVHFFDLSGNYITDHFQQYDEYYEPIVKTTSNQKSNNDIDDLIKKVLETDIYSAENTVMNAYSGSRHLLSHNNYVYSNVQDIIIDKGNGSMNEFGGNWDNCILSGCTTSNDKCYKIEFWYGGDDFDDYQGFGRMHGVDETKILFESILSTAKNRFGNINSEDELGDDFYSYTAHWDNYKGKSVELGYGNWVNDSNVSFSPYIYLVFSDNNFDLDNLVSNLFSR